MSSQGFQRRVEQLRDSWMERRELKGLSSVHDFESQFTLLLTLHTWTEAAVQDIRAVYGPELAIGLSPRPESTGKPAFSVTIADQYTVNFILTERRRVNGVRWFVAVTIGSGGPGGAIAAAGPERRNGQWTRLRVEDILLSVLGAYERNQAEGGRTNLRAWGA